MVVFPAIYERNVVLYSFCLQGAVHGGRGSGHCWAKEYKSCCIRLCTIVYLPIKSVALVRTEKL